jgi:hypothetical protein
MTFQPVGSAKAGAQFSPLPLERPRKEDSQNFFALTVLAGLDSPAEHARALAVAFQLRIIKRVSLQQLDKSLARLIDWSNTRSVRI